MKKNQLQLNSDWNPIRYNKIYDKCPREICMLRGRGCSWRRCRFCDYHLDCSSDQEANFLINSQALANVTGEFGALEVINSGSFPELDDKTIALIKQICKDKKISTLYIEAHYRYRHQLAAIRQSLAPVVVRIKLGVETFDVDYRERVLDKGIGDATPAEIASYFDDCCLLVGMRGQTREMISHDIEVAAAHFDRVCVNVFIANGTHFPPDPALIAWFVDYWYPRLKDDPRFDLLLDNNAFGVGGVCSQP